MTVVWKRNSGPSVCFLKPAWFLKQSPIGQLVRFSPNQNKGLMKRYIWRVSIRLLTRLYRWSSQHLEPQSGRDSVICNDRQSMWQVKLLEVHWGEAGWCTKDAFRLDRLSADYLVGMAYWFWVESKPLQCPDCLSVGWYVVVYPHYNWSHIDQ